MNELALFAGAGGGILGGHLLGWRTVCAVEWEAYPASVLCARQNDGILPTFPIWDDVQTFDGKPWQGIVDVVSGGFPCQDISVAGKGDGLDGERSGMWNEMARIIGEVRPQYTFIENSPMLTVRGLERILADLASLGFNAEWGVLSAADVGANHGRNRIWIVGKMANTKKLQRNGSNNNSGISLEAKQISELRNSSGKEDLANANSKRGCLWQTNWENAKNAWESPRSAWRRNWWNFEPNVGRVANGVASRVERLKAIGNGQVPICAATAWRLLKERLDGQK
jgi:DNA (cytosine-5)-methyltransferase 1